MAQNDSLLLSGIFDGLEKGRLVMTDKTTGENIELSCEFSERQIGILRAGGLLPYTKNN